MNFFASRDSVLEVKSIRLPIALLLSRPLLTGGKLEAGLDGLHGETPGSFSSSHNSPHTNQGGTLGDKEVVNGTLAYVMVSSFYQLNLMKI